jgi:hypothetical protein
MEVLDLLFVLIQGCGCFLEFMAVGSNVGAGVAAVKVQKVRKARQVARAQGEPPPPDNRAVAALVALLFAAVFFTGLVLWKWLSPH